MPDDPLKSRQWDESYQRGENYVFYPHEEVIRFVARHIRKRVGQDQYEDRLGVGQARGLALGCGIGRHVFYLDECGLEAWGIDLSEEAIGMAHASARRLGREHLVERFLATSSESMPFDDGFFHFAVSHGVLDSMPFDVARRSLVELRRCLAPNGLFYADLVSGDDHRHGREFAGAEEVQGQHEQGTIQSYFNWSRIEELIEGSFKVKDGVLITSQSLFAPVRISRYHLVLERL